MLLRTTQKYVLGHRLPCDASQSDARQTRVDKDDTTPSLFLIDGRLLQGIALLYRYGNTHV